MHHYLDIDPSAATPIWRQIEDGMRRLVASGRLSAGEVVPSVRELARDLRVNPATVSKAYQRLTDAGLMTVRRGEGTFVAQLSQDALAALKRKLLVENAAAYIRVAISIDADREEALRAVEDGWPNGSEVGGGVHDE